MFFKGTDLNNYIGYSHLNEMINIKVKFDLLEEVNADDIVIYQEKESQLRDLLLEVKNRITLLFIGVEQGLGKHKNDVLIIIMARNRIAVHQ